MGGPLLTDRQVQATLERIRCTAGDGVALGRLAELQRAFLLHVPFENLDIHRGRPSRLGVDAAFAKIVGEHRGGYCYELNGLFAALLEAEGFRVDLLAARMYKDGKPGIPFAHLALCVHLEEDWLVDVGNGQSFREPLRLDGGNLTKAERMGFRVGVLRGQPHLLQWKDGESPQPRFVFDRVPRRIEDFAEANTFHQTSPESHFTRRPFATLALPDGRVTLAGETFTLRQGETDEERIVDEVEATELFRRWFGIQKGEIGQTRRRKQGIG